MLLTFPEDPQWSSDRQAVEFGVIIGEYEGVVRVPRRLFQRLLPGRPIRREAAEGGPQCKSEILRLEIRGSR